MKLALLIGLLIFLVSLPLSAYWGFAAVGLSLFIVALLSGIPLLYLLRRLLLLEIFVVGVALLSLFQSNGAVLFAALVMRSTLCLAAVLLFSSTTPFSDVLDQLRRWHVPSLLITLLALMYRYLFVLFIELERMRSAQRGRTFTENRWILWHSLATIISQLFIRSVNRAERIYAAMCARGWQ